MIREVPRAGQSKSSRGISQDEKCGTVHQIADRALRYLPNLDRMKHYDESDNEWTIVHNCSNAFKEDIHASFRNSHLSSAGFKRRKGLRFPKQQTGEVFGRRFPKTRVKRHTRNANTLLTLPLISFTNMCQKFSAGTSSLSR